MTRAATDSWTRLECRVRAARRGPVPRRGRAVVIETFVARGSAEVDQRREQLERHVTTTARSTGQVRVAVRLPDAARTRRALSCLRSAADAAHAGAATPERRAAAPAMPTPVVTRSVPPGGATALRRDGCRRAASCRSPATTRSRRRRSSSASPASRADELDAVRDYETAHRNRRTILGKIEQLGRAAV